VVLPETGFLSYPHCLPDGRILAIRSTPDSETASVVVVSPKEEEVVLLSLPISNRTDVKWPVLVGPDIVFERLDPTPGLWAFPVDADLRRKTTAEPGIVLQNASRPSTGAGMLTVLTGVNVVDRNLVLVDRSGRRTAAFGKPQREFLTPSLSPDADQVITGGRRQNVYSLWMHTKDAGTLRGLRRPCGTAGACHADIYRWWPLSSLDQDRPVLHLWPAG